MATHSAPQISVIVPVYKTPLNYFKECLDSLYNQTLQDAEFILVFDGENKDLFSISNTYKEKDDRFKIFIQPHLGVSATRNFGIKQAKGEYIAFVDADDILCSDILNEAYTFAKKNSSNIIIWDCSIYNGVSAERRSIANYSIDYLSSEQKKEVLKSVISMKNPNWISTAGPWCKLYKKELLQETPFDSKFILRQDRILNIKLFSKNISISYLHKNGYLYRSAVRTFRPNLLQISLTFIDAMDEITGDFYPEGIGQETFNSIWEAWHNSVLHPQNIAPLTQRVYEFNNLLKTKKKQKTKMAKIKNSKFEKSLKIKEIDNKIKKYLNTIENYKTFPLSTKFELFFLKHRITISMWLRALIWSINKKRK